MSSAQSGGIGGQANGPAPRRRFGTATRRAVGLGIAAILIGGAVLGVSLTSGGARPQSASALLAGDSGRGAGGRAAAAGGLGLPTSVRSVSVAAGPGDQAGPGAQRDITGLRGCVAAARHLRATGHRRAARAKLRSCLRRYLRLRLLAGHAMHGQITFATRKGPRTLVFERGAIQTASASSVVVKAADGTTWTWSLTSSTVVTRAGQRIDPGALSAGQRVIVVGLAAGGADDARRIFVGG